MSGRFPGRRAWRVWQRNATVYRRVWLSNLLGHLADPLFYLAVLGFGLGSLMPAIEGVPYVSYLFAGVIAGAAMSSACFECSYGSYVRLSSQGTFDAILATPVSIADLAGGEVLWAATKALISAAATVVIGLVFGVFVPGWGLLLLLVPVLLQGLFFGGIALAVAAFVDGFEGLNHFYALFIMPVLFLSGVFFPLDGLPSPLQALALVNPLTHAVHLVRPLSGGLLPAGWALELLWLGIAGLAGVLLAVASLRRRLVI